MAKAPPSQQQIANYAQLSPADKAKMDAISLSMGLQPPTFAEQKGALNDLDYVYYTDSNGQTKYGPRPANTYQDPFQGDLMEGLDPYPKQQWEYVDDPNRQNVRQPDGSVQKPLPPIPDPTGNQPPSGGMPPPTGDGSYEEWTPDLSAGKPSWNWDYFKPKAPGDGEWSGYDEDYGVFERYQPGQDSPWGMADIEGGNTDFYQQQFNNLLRDEQDFRTRQRAAQLRASESAANPAGAINFDDMWSSMDLPEVQMGTGKVQSTSYNLNPTYEGMTNQEAWNSMKNLGAFGDRDTNKYMDNYFARNDFGGANDWGTYGDPNAAFASINPESWKGMKHAGVVQDTLAQVMNNIYQGNQQGPKAPVGYASPVSTGQGV